MLPAPTSTYTYHAEDMTFPYFLLIGSGWLGKASLFGLEYFHFLTPGSVITCL